MSYALSVSTEFKEQKSPVGPPHDQKCFDLCLNTPAQGQAVQQRWNAVCELKAKSMTTVQAEAPCCDKNGPACTVNFVDKSVSKIKLIRVPCVLRTRWTRTNNNCSFCLTLTLILCHFKCYVLLLGATKQQLQAYQIIIIPFDQSALKNLRTKLHLWILLFRFTTLRRCLSVLFCLFSCKLLPDILSKQNRKSALAKSQMSISI